jgi:hypothetical protein
VGYGRIIVRPWLVAGAEYIDKRSFAVLDRNRKKKVNDHAAANFHIKASQSINNKFGGI